MRRDGLGDTRFYRLALNHNQYHGTREMSTTTVEEHIILLAVLDVHMATIIKPPFKLTDGFRRDRHQSFFGTFTQHTDILFRHIKIGEFEIDQF